MRQLRVFLAPNSLPCVHLTKDNDTQNSVINRCDFPKGSIIMQREKHTSLSVKEKCQELKIYFLLEPHPPLSECALKHTEISNCHGEGHRYLSQAAGSAAHFASWPPPSLSLLPKWQKVQQRKACINRKPTASKDFRSSFQSFENKIQNNIVIVVDQSP